METSPETANALVEADAAIARKLFIDAWGVIALAGLIVLLWLLPFVSPPGWLIWTFWLWTLGAWPLINWQFRRERTKAVFGALARTAGDIAGWAVRVTMNYLRERGVFRADPAPRPAGVAALFASGAALEPAPPPSPQPRSARAAYAKPPPEDEPPSWPRMEYHFRWAGPLFGLVVLLTLVALVLNRCDGARVERARNDAAGARAETNVANEQTGAVRVAIQAERRTATIITQITEEARHARASLRAVRPDIAEPAAPPPSDADFAALELRWRAGVERLRDLSNGAGAAASY